ncbi:hypothetical protein [Pararhizobium sp.]|uniref:hypothetical protein n=1 Tax=Pararhizobium sp. TaxID=1977563 RepID=UPI00271B5BE2|nr:hypothetical protein [Pararhizobium sp.]MDO9416235.1 hypothetical protein [Pararhizobium sp.]
MNAQVKDSLFAQKKSPSQRHDDITSAVNTIIDKEKIAREKKTERLRQLRLAKDAEDAAAAPPVQEKPKSKARAAKA